MNASRPLLTLTEVSKTFFSAPGTTPLAVLDAVSMSVAPGEFVAVVGPSGSGKSTLLNMMGGLDTATSGTIVFADRRLADLSDRELAQLRNREIGFVFQLHHLLPQCTVLENVLLPTLARASDRTGGGEARALELLGRVGLAERAAYRPSQLSGGERQRTALVRALINQPRLLLADEPTGSLDRAAAEQTVALLRELNREQNVAVVMVTHATDLVSRSDRVFALRDRKLVRQ